MLASVFDDLSSAAAIRSLGLPCPAAARIKNFSTRAAEWSQNKPIRQFSLCSNRLQGNRQAGFPDTCLQIAKTN
jgi:hypothetical protein